MTPIPDDSPHVQLIGIGVIKAMLSRDDEWAYRIPFGLQWMWPVPLCIGIALAPESPWWLVRKRRYEEAKHSILRLTSTNRETDFNVDETIASELGLGCSTIRAQLTPLNRLSSDEAHDRARGEDHRRCQLPRLLQGYRPPPD